MYNNWDKPLIEIMWRSSKGTKTYKSWQQGRLAAIALDIIALIVVIKWIIEWLSK